MQLAPFADRLAGAKRSDEIDRAIEALGPRPSGTRPLYREGIANGWRVHRRRLEDHRRSLEDWDVAHEALMKERAGVPFDFPGINPSYFGE